MKAETILNATWGDQLIAVWDDICTQSRETVSTLEARQECEQTLLFVERHTQSDTWRKLLKEKRSFENSHTKSEAQTELLKPLATNTLFGQVHKLLKIWERENYQFTSAVMPDMRYGESRYKITSFKTTPPALFKQLTLVIKTISEIYFTEAKTQRLQQGIKEQLILCLDQLINVRKMTFSHFEELTNLILREEESCNSTLSLHQLEFTSPLHDTLENCPAQILNGAFYQGIHTARVLARILKSHNFMRQQIMPLLLAACFQDLGRLSGYVKRQDQAGNYRAKHSPGKAMTKANSYTLQHADISAAITQELSNRSIAISQYIKHHHDDLPPLPQSHQRRFSMDPLFYAQYFLNHTARFVDVISHDIISQKPKDIWWTYQHTSHAIEWLSQIQSEGATGFTGDRLLFSQLLELCENSDDHYLWNNRRSLLPRPIAKQENTTRESTTPQIEGRVDSHSSLRGPHYARSSKAKTRESMWMVEE